MSTLINADLVALDAQLGDDKDGVIRSLAQLVADAGRSDDPDGLAGDAFARESKSVTGMPGGLAIPHCRSPHVNQASLAFARLRPPVDFGAKDAPADLVFFIAAPAEGDADHLKLLTQLARALVRKDFTDGLRAARTPDEVVALVDGVVQPPAAPEPTTVAEAATQTSQQRTIVAVTACPTGIAHTFMAAESLEAAGKKAGVNLIVEPQGSTGVKPLAASLIQSADAVIFATDVGVRDKGRFEGLPEINASVKAGIHEADQLVSRALAAADDPNAPRVAAAGGGGSGSGGARVGTGGEGESILIKVRTALLTGVSYMIPFVAAGGLLIALGFLFGGYEMALAYKNTGGNLAAYVIGNFKITDLPSGSISPHALLGSGFFVYLGAVMFSIGAASFSFLVPALAGYIAYAIADRPGIAPGFTSGLIASQIGAGFIGGIVGGLLAGVVAHWIASFAVPKFVRGLMPVVIIPLFATLIAGGLMYIVLGRPLAWVTTELGKGLNNMNGSSAIILGLVLGLMMCFDLGGPVNKAAYVFATTGLSTNPSPANLKIMAAVMLAGMVPPLALALASTLRPALFTEPERENGRAAWLLGASFISEGAIPFAAADPLRIIPAVMAGGAVTGALSEAFGVQLRAPHGGIFVLFAVSGVVWFLLSLVLGTVIAAFLVITLKRGHPDTELEPNEAVTVAA
jgi:PTS system fructose-specific IIC component